MRSFYCGCPARRAAENAFSRFVSRALNLRERLRRGFFKEKIFLFFLLESYLNDDRV